MDSLLLQDFPNVALMVNVNCVMLPTAFDVHAEMEGTPSEIMHLEPLVHLIID